MGFLDGAKRALGLVPPDAPADPMQGGMGMGADPAMMEPAPVVKDPPPLPGGFSREIERAKKERVSDEEMWDICIRFVEGVQRLTGLTKGTSASVRFQQGLAGDLTRRRQSDHAVNILITPWRFMLSRLTIVYPSMGVLPASNGTDDVGKSEASEQALNYYWWAEDVRKKDADLNRWMTLTGNAALWNVYDPGDGRTHCRVVSPYDLLHEPGSTDPDESDWTAVRTLYKRDVLKKAYPNKAAAIDEAVAVGEKPEARGPKDRIEVWDVYWREGWHGVLVGDDWLWGTDEGEGWVPEGGEIPIQHVRYTTIPGRLWGIGMIHNAIDPVLVFKEKNDQIVDAIRLAASPKVLIPEQSNIRSTAFKAVGAEKIEFSTMGGPPTYMHADPIPDAAFRDIARVVELINDILGIHSTSLGKTATNVESGAHVEVLTQNDASQLQTTQEEIAAAFRKHAKVALVHMKAYYTEERSIAMYDDDGEFVFGQIHGLNLVDAPEVFLEADSLFRDGVVERRRKALALVDAGVLSAADAADEIALGTRSKRLLDRIEAMSHAKKMLLAVIAGEGELELYPTDDLTAFEKVFGEYMRKGSFYRLVPAVQARVAATYARIVQMKVGFAGMAQDAADAGVVRAEANKPAPPGAPGPLPPTPRPTTGSPTPAGPRIVPMARTATTEAGGEQANRGPANVG